MANSFQHSLYHKVESTYGTTPSSPAFVHFRHTGFSTGVSKSGITSEELYSDRQLRNLRHGNKSISGDITGELSYGSHDAMIEAALGGTWSAPSVTITAATISATASGNTIDDSGSGFGSFTVGMLVYVSGFTGSTTNNGVALITAQSAASLTLSGLTLTDDAAGESVTVTAMDVVSNGTTRRSFSMIRDFSDLTDGRYQLYTGCELNSLSLSTTLDAIVNMTFGIIGKGQTSSASAPASSTFGAATTTEPLVAFDGCLSEAGTESAVVTAADLSLDNGMEAKFNLCSDETAQPGIGRSTVTGNITAYFDNDVLMNKFLAETESTLKIEMADAAGNRFAVFLPRIKYTGGQPDVGGEVNGSISLPWTALRETTSTASVIIGRLAV